MTAHSGRGQSGDSPYEGVVLPANGESWTPEQQREAEAVGGAPQPAVGRPWGQQWGPGTPSPPAGPPPVPQLHVPHGHGDTDATQLLPPQQSGPPGASGGEIGESWPPQTHYQADADATQMLPPQQYPSQQWPPPAQADADATQMLPPQQYPQSGPSGALPPEVPYGQQPVGAEPGPPPSGAPYGIRPGEPDDRQPPSEFDNLFRSAAPAAGGHPRGPSGPGGPVAHPEAAGPTGPSRLDHGHEPARRRPSPAVLAGIGLVVVVAIGLGVGALTSGGGEDSEAGPSSPSAPADDSSEKPADTPEEQAKALNTLLEKSNNSRNSVIRAVQNIKKCQKLDEAATDLRAAADQREGLVNRLSQIDTGSLPDSAPLDASLAEAWKASAEADDAYAAWADQVAGKKGCHKGTARTTRKTALGNRASGEATAAKKKAAGLWNPTAREHGLPERQYTQL
ncbi:hypothetical protein N566_01955 [Streptomycetaceae bacterium MP113-05]|nr:hypothetical protein N566_01955 [Streptomycetaceae bacterium MP113-05]